MRAEAGASVRILGVDPGSRAAGVAVITWSSGRGQLVAAKTLRVEGEMAGRLEALHRGLGEFIAEHRPDEAAFEKVFIARNPQSALKLGQARGVLMLAVAQQKLPLAEYSATRVKKATLGYGRATKAEMQRMIKLEFGADLSADAADAVAIALTHAVIRSLPQAAWGQS